MIPKLDADRTLAWFGCLVSHLRYHFTHSVDPGTSPGQTLCLNQSDSYFGVAKIPYEYRQTTFDMEMIISDGAGICSP